MTGPLGAQAALLPDGRRLHLQHGPIDLIVEVAGAGRAEAYNRATTRFRTVLQELADELPVLRQPVGTNVTGPVARRMVAATLPLAPDFLTPMAAVAGAVADEMLSVLCADPSVAKAYVNNGGDVAFHLSGTHRITAAIAACEPARITLTSADPWRGMATSGWSGRSHSLGIADSVTVLAASAAQADAAATLIANAVDLPGDPRITRVPARALSPDSDLGDRKVTTAVAALDPASRTVALNRGVLRAQNYVNRGLIGAAFLTLQGDTRNLGPVPARPLPDPETLDA